MSGVANVIYPSTPMSFYATLLGTLQQTYLSVYENVGKSLFHCSQNM